MKKLLTILVLIMLIVSFFQIANMYALYKEQLQSDYSSLLGVWAIKVNGIDISSGEENLTFTMTEDNLQYINSVNIKDGKIAPSGQACFEIVIDPTNTDVSILYCLNIGLDTITSANMNLIRVENYFQKDGETETVTNETVNTGVHDHTAVIPIGKINENYLNHIKLYFEWTNVEGNNETDSVLGATENAKISVPLDINLKQYTGEVINGDGQI